MLEACAAAWELFCVSVLDSPKVQETSQPVLVVDPLAQVQCNTHGLARTCGTCIPLPDLPWSLNLSDILAYDRLVHMRKSRRLFYAPRLVLSKTLKTRLTLQNLNSLHYRTIILILLCILLPYHLMSLSRMTTGLIKNF